MYLSIDTEKKQIILEPLFEYSFEKLFNIIHKLDPDNSQEWTVVNSLNTTYIPMTTDYSSFTISTTNDQDYFSNR